MQLQLRQFFQGKLTFPWSHPFLWSLSSLSSSAVWPCHGGNTPLVWACKSRTTDERVWEPNYMLHTSVGFAHPNRWSQKPTCGQNLWYWSRPLSGTRQFLSRPFPVNNHDTSYDSEVLVYALDTISGSEFWLVSPLLPLWPWRQFQNREKQNHVSVCLDHPLQRSPLRWQFFD